MSGCETSPSDKSSGLLQEVWIPARGKKLKDMHPIQGICNKQNKKEQ
jgi:hypothetical protein